MLRAHGEPVRRRLADSVGELPFREQHLITWIGPQAVRKRRVSDPAYVSMCFACASQPLECPVMVAAVRIYFSDLELVPVRSIDQLFQRRIRGIRLTDRVAGERCYEQPQVLIVDYADEVQRPLRFVPEKVRLGDHADRV
jgi:hypothetical protein